MAEITLLVLAAGIGRRYKGLKQVEPVGLSGEAILDYSLHDALQAGFEKVVFVIRKEIQALFRREIGSYWESRAPVRYIFQEIAADRQKPWGTGQAVLLCREVIDSPFAVINSDDFYGPSSYREMFTWLRSQAKANRDTDEYSFIGFRLGKTLSEFGPVARAVCELDEEGYLKGIVERLKIEKEGDEARMWLDDGRWVKMRGNEVVSMNFWGFTRSFFSHAERSFAAFLRRSEQDEKAEFFIPLVVNELVVTGKAKIRCLPTAERWFGITYPEDLARVRAEVEKLIQQGFYPEKIRR